MSQHHSPYLTKIMCGDVSESELLDWIDSLTENQMDDYSLLSSTVSYKQSLMSLLLYSPLDESTIISAIKLCIAKGANPFKVHRHMLTNVLSIGSFVSNLLAFQQFKSDEFNEEIQSFIVEVYSEKILEENEVKEFSLLVGNVLGDIDL